MKAIFGFFVVGLFLSGCSATGGSTNSVGEAPEKVSDDTVAEANDDGMYCRREHVLRGSRLKTMVCKTTAQRTEEERMQQRNREGIRRMQDASSNARGQEVFGSGN